MLKALVTFILFAPAFLFAQTSISGKITAGKRPLAGASVFLSNSSVGGMSAENGSFGLHNIHNGQYDMVISCIGYETHHQDVFINGENLNLPDVEMVPKIVELKTVNINFDPDREEHLRAFMTQFLGPGANAKKCTILNPDIIDIKYAKKTRMLKASTEDFLVIENKALGYTIKYLLQTFEYDMHSGLVYYAGSPVFEPMHGTEREEKNWTDARKQAYLGSSMHFLRSCIADNLKAQHFDVVNLVRPRKDKGLTIVEDGGNKLPPNTPLTTNNFIHLTDRAGIFAITFPDCLVVSYRKKEDRTSIMTFVEDYSFFDMNGVVLNPQSNTMEGLWAKQRVADLLPVDYELPVN